MTPEAEAVAGACRLRPRLRRPAAAPGAAAPIEDPLALALLEGRYLEGATVTVDAAGDDSIVLR